MLRRALSKEKFNKELAQTLFQKIVQSDAWRLLSDMNGRLFSSFDAFCESPNGLDFKRAEIERRLGKHGRPKDEEKPTGGRFKYGGNPAYILARLDRDGHAELAAAVRAKTISANAAAIEAGFRKKHDCYDVLVRAWNACSAEERNRFVAALRDATLNEFRSPQVRKPRSAKVGPKTQAVRTTLQVNESLGTDATDAEIAAALGVSVSTVAEARRDLRSARDENLGKVKFLKAQEHHIEAAIKAKTKELEAGFEERVRLAVLERNKSYRADLEKIRHDASAKLVQYNDLINHHRATFTEVEFSNIRNCLHPDNSASPEKRAAAFAAFNAKKLQLVGSK